MMRRDPSRMPWGPKRAPGRAVVAVSKGAPRMAMSYPSTAPRVPTTSQQNGPPLKKSPAGHTPDDQIVGANLLGIKKKTKMIEKTYNAVSNLIEFATLEWVRERSSASCQASRIGLKAYRIN